MVHKENSDKYHEISTEFSNGQFQRRSNSSNKIVHSKNYKRKLILDNMKEANKKGQVAIFVIVAIVIVVGIILVYLLAPKFIPGVQSSSSENPQAFIETCLKEEIANNIEIAGNGGGFLNPAGTVMSKGIEYKYLCYTNENYVPCVVQEPFVKDRIESEMTNVLKAKTESCVRQFAQASERSGNKVSVGSVSESVELNPGRLVVNIFAPMTITKDISRSFNKFRIEYPTKMYELSMLVTSIISFEATYGASETTTYLQYYPDIKIEKNELSDGTTIYIVSDVTTNEKIAFASRSLAWPAGSELN